MHACMHLSPSMFVCLPKFVVVHGASLNSWLGPFCILLFLLFVYLAIDEENEKHTILTRGEKAGS
jgi:hypothetical protein